MANSSFFGTSGTTASVTNTIQTSVDAAEAAQAAAEAAQTAAETAETNSETAQAASEAARDLAQGYRDTAATHKNDAETAKSSAEAAQTASENARDAASTSASNSSTSETNAASSATQAASSATSAASSSTSAAASLASFQGQYSTGTTDPTTNLNTGDLFFNATDDEFKVYNGTAWQLTIPTSSNQTNINTVSGIQSDVTAVAGKATEVGRLGTTDAVADMNLLGTSTNVSNMSTLAANNSNITTVANNISGVNSFADRYRTGATDPSSDNDEGDLFYNTTSNALKVYTGSAWEQGVTAGSGFLPLSGGQLTGNLTFSGSQTVDGRDVSADGTKLDGIETGADVTDTTNVVAALTAGTNVTIAADGTISSTDTNTTYSNATTSVAGLMSAGDKTKLDGVEASADVTDTANVVAALTAGTNVTIAADGTISSTDTDTTYSNATTSVAGLMSAADKTKLDGVEASADVTDTTNVVAALTAGTNVTIAADGTISSTDTNTTYSNATTSVAGLMSAADKTKLDGVEASADVTDTTNVVAALTAGTNVTIAADGTISSTDTNTTYTAGGDYGLTLSGTEFRLEDDRRRNATDVDVRSGNTHDFTFYDASHGVRWYTAGVEEMRLENDGDLHVDGNITAYSTTISDPRLKEDIQPVTDALAKVEKLNGYTFTYRHDGSASAGVVSTEVADVLPSAIRKSKVPLVAGHDNETEYDIVQYDQLHALLIEAVKELSARVKELENDTSN